MQDSDAPLKMPIPWASSAGGGYITYPVPEASQIGIANGRASFATGFPPLNFVPVATGGAGPFGDDTNGLLYQLTAGTRWLQAGGPIYHDATFSATIGGYPKDAVVHADGVQGKFWISTTENNVTDPDTGGAGWAAYEWQQSGAAGQAITGQCRLHGETSTLIRLIPYNGNAININGAVQLIPVGGVTLANTGLVAATFYYIYVFMSGSTMTLEASTTTPAINTNGIMVKTGDASRSLVGAVFTDSGSPGTFALSPTKLWVISHYNRRMITGKNVFTVDRSTTSTSYVEIHSEIRIQFISWLADELIRYYVDGQCTNTATVNGVLTGVGFDGSVTPGIEGAGGDPGGAANLYFSAALSGTFDQVGFAENANHYATVLGEVTAGTGLWLALAGNNAGIVLGITVNG